MLESLFQNEVFKKAVEDVLPYAIPVTLENCGDYKVGRVLVYSKKPLEPVAQLKFTGCSIENLLADGQKITITIASNNLHVTGKSVSSLMVKANLDADLDLSLLFGGSLDFSDGQDRDLDVVTDFGKILQISSDLVAKVINNNLYLKVEHPTVQEAINNGGVIFFIHTIFESEHVKLSAKLFNGTTEGAGEDVKAKVKEDTKKGVDDQHTSCKGTVFLLK